MTKKILLAALILTIIAILGYGILSSRPNSEKTVEIRGKQFRTEVVDTPRKMALGLGERDALCADCAMLFIFPEKKNYPFWMKGMRFSLDILWFDSADGRIIHLEKNIAPDFKENLVPSGAADRVLELNAGSVDRYGIGMGDSVIVED